MSTPLDRLLSAARSAVQHVRGRYQTEEPDYMDALASALGQYVQANRAEQMRVAVTACAAGASVLDRARELVALHDDGEPRDTSLEGRLALACAVVDLDESLSSLDALVDGPIGAAAGEPIGLREAFAAGAEYMRRSAQVVYEAAPYCGTTIKLPGMLMPDAERIDAAAVGYVEGIGR